MGFLELKSHHALFFGFCFALMFVVALAAWMSTKIRRLLIIFLPSIVLRAYHSFYDVNIISREWYKGSTRGFEFTISEFYFYGIAIGCIVASIRSHRLRNLFNITNLFYVLLVFLGGISLYWADPILFSLFEFHKWLRGLLVLILSYLVFSKKENLESLLMGFAVSAIEQGTLGLWQRYVQGMHRVRGSFLHPNLYSIWFVLVFPFIFCNAISEHKKKIVHMLYIGATVFSWMGIILSLSRAGLGLGVFAIFVILLLTVELRKLIDFRFIVISIMLISVLGLSLFKARKNILHRAKNPGGEFALMDYENKQGTNRRFYYELYKLMRRDFPYGYGLNNWSWWATNVYGPELGKNYVSYNSVHESPPPPTRDQWREIRDNNPQALVGHSIYLLIGAELGIVGLILLILFQISFLLSLLVKIIRTKDRFYKNLYICLGVSFVCSITYSVTDYTIRATPIYLLVTIFYSLLSVKVHNEQEKKDKELRKEMLTASILSRR